MERNDLLPEDFLIKRDGRNELWQPFIDYLNRFFEGVEPAVQLKGETEGYYGLIDDCPILLDNPGDIPIMSLEEWDAVMNGDADSQEKVIDINGVEQLKRQCVQLSDEDPTNAGEYALRSEAIFISHLSLFVLKSNATRTMNSGWLIAGDERLYFSEFHDDWINCEGSDVCYGYVSRGCEEYFYDPYDNRVSINDEYFVNAGVAEECGYINGRRGWRHEEDGYDCVDDCNASYHELSRVNKFDNSAEFTVGFEIEKEDDEAGLIHYDSLYDDTRWIKEHDGSLDDDNGYELVSPAFNLFNDDLEKDINSDERLTRLINADMSTSCGGHINLASKNYTPEQLFEGLSSFFPLLYSLYDGRLDKTYSKAKQKHKYYDRDKYSALFIKDSVLEFRIFSAVKNVSNLMWRRDLMRIMCININVSELDVLRMLLNHKSELYIHLRKVYSQDKLINKIEGFVKMCSDFNNKKLPEIIRANIKNDNIDTTSELGA